MYVLMQKHHGTFKFFKEKNIMATLAEIRAKLNSQENRTGSNQGGGDNAIFAHWNIPEGTTSRIRFLPDSNSKNDFYWVERAMIRLPFNGIKGDVNSKPQIVQVPCMEMYGDACPILAEVRTWFKDSSLEEMGRKYWKKRSYVFQGFVRESSLADDNQPENPIRRFIISPQIFNIVKAALMDPEMEELPTDFERGLDFSVVKTSKGGYADYSTSKYSRKESALSATERAAIDQYGLFNLGDFLPKKPTDVELKVIKEMFEASVDGQAYDPDRWSQYFKPAGFNGGGSNASSASAPAPKPTPAQASAPVDTDEDDVAEVSSPVATKPASSGTKNAEDILAMIRSRQK
jgi:hypothetical protein